MPCYPEVVWLGLGAVVSFTSDASGDFIRLLLRLVEVEEVLKDKGEEKWKKDNHANADGEESKTVKQKYGFFLRRMCPLFLAAPGYFHGAMVAQKYLMGELKIRYVFDDEPGIGF